MKKKNQFRLAVIAFIALLTSSCILTIDGVVGKGSIVSEDISVESFTSVELATSANVEISKGTELKVTLSDYENLLDYWDIEVINNSLIIKTKSFTSFINSKAKVIIEMPEPLYSVTLAGSGNVKLIDSFNDLNDISILGSGNFTSETDAQYNDLEVLISGSGNMIVNGSVQNLTAKIAGSGNMRLSNLEAQNANCYILGSGNMYINVIQSLKANISGSGDIVYSGNPTLDFSGLGSGHLRHN